MVFITNLGSPMSSKTLQQEVLVGRRWGVSQNGVDSLVKVFELVPTTDESRNTGNRWWHSQTWTLPMTALCSFVWTIIV